MEFWKLVSGFSVFCHVELPGAITVWEKRGENNFKEDLSSTFVCKKGLLYTPLLPHTTRPSKHLLPLSRRYKKIGRNIKKSAKCVRKVQ